MARVFVTGSANVSLCGVPAIGRQLEWRGKTVAGYDPACVEEPGTGGYIGRRISD
jgi:hypothetical protein